MTDWISKAMFAAPWWALPLNPTFLSRRALWCAMSRAAPLVKGKLLDVGCGTKPYRSLFSGVDEYVGLELDTEFNRRSRPAELFYDGSHFPVLDNSFDAVVCNQVLEHVFRPEKILAEISRVLRPNGILILSVPFLWPEHEQPYDRLRYTSFGLRDHLSRAGLCVEYESKLTRGYSALCALAADRINSRLRASSLTIRLVGRAIFITPLSVLGWLLAPLTPTDVDLYLDNFVICRNKI